MQKIIKYSLVLLWVNVFFAQSSIITGGNQNETIGENVTRMQTFDTIVKKEVSLGVPKYEIPAEQPKPKPAKKKSFIEKLLDFIKQLFN